jgi:hypothetical protein
VKKLTLLFFTIVGISGFSFSQTQFGDTLFSFNAGILTPAPDRTLFGVEFVDGHFWVTGMNAPVYDHRLYKICADGNNLISYTSLGTDYHAFYDLAYDGQFLYATDKDRIVQIDLNTGLPTGVETPISFGYLLLQGLAYDPATDHFWVIPQRNGQLQIIYEIDRSGNILGSYPNNSTDYTSALAWDTLSLGGPFLWTFSSEANGYNSRGVMKQFSPAVGTFTGVEIEMKNRSPYVLDTPLGISFTPALDSTTVTMIALQAGSINVTDGLDWLVVYNADLRNQPGLGAQMTVSPTSIQTQIHQGDSLNIPVFIGNIGQANLTWDAYVENADTSNLGNGLLGDSLFSINLIATIGDSNLRVNSVTFARDYFWVSGRILPNQKSLFKIDKNGNLVATYPIGSLSSFGWSSIATDGNNIYGTDTYSIAVWSIDSTQIVDNIFTGSTNADAFAYDPNNKHLYLSNRNGAIEVLDRQGNQVRFMLTPYEIEGLAWDNYSPGGPFLWAWTVSDDTTSSRCEALRLNPQSGLFTGVRFGAVNLGTLQNFPESATIMRDITTNKLVFVGLQQDDEYPGSEAFLVGYDLDAVLPPAWIKLLGSTQGNVAPLTEDTLFVRLHAMMADTTTAAVIKINSNDLVRPIVEIPVTTVNLAPLTTSIDREIGNVLLRFNLEQNYPNPFNPITNIRFSLSQQSRVTLKLYDILGRQLLELINEFKQAGEHVYKLNASNLPSGIYLYTLEAGDYFTDTKKLILMK